MAYRMLASDRVGKILIHEHMFSDEERLKELEQVFAIAGLIPLHIEAQPWSRGYMFTATSHKFEEIDVAEEPPEYICEITVSPNLLGGSDVTGVKFIRIDYWTFVGIKHSGKQYL